jgi:hypothetical protein
MIYIVHNHATSRLHANLWNNAHTTTDVKEFQTGLRFLHQHRRCRKYYKIRQVLLRPDSSALHHQSDRLQNTASTSWCIRVDWVDHFPVGHCSRRWRRVRVHWQARSMRFQLPPWLVSYATCRRAPASGSGGGNNHYGQRPLSCEPVCV